MLAAGREWRFALSQTIQGQKADVIVSVEASEHAVRFIQHSLINRGLTAESQQHSLGLCCITDHISRLCIKRI